MRAAGNLAGVSFIDAPLYSANRDTWREIISESGYFFTVDTMRFFSSRVLWDTLEEVAGGYVFLTSEAMPNGPREYNLRTWDAQNGVDTVDTFPTLKQAHAARRQFVESGHGA